MWVKRIWKVQTRSKKIAGNEYVPKRAKINIIKHANRLYDNHLLGKKKGKTLLRLNSVGACYGSLIWNLACIPVEIHLGDI